MPAIHSYPSPSSSTSWLREACGQNSPVPVLIKKFATEPVKLPEVKRGVVLLPRQWVVERTFGWATRFRRLVRDYERLPQTPADLHVIALVCRMLRQAVNYIAVHNSL